MLRRTIGIVSTVALIAACANPASASVAPSTPADGSTSPASPSVPPPTPVVAPASATVAKSLQFDWTYLEIDRLRDAGWSEFERAVVTDDLIVAFGGPRGGVAVSPNGVDWRIPDDAPSHLHATEAAWIGDRLWVYGYVGRENDRTHRVYTTRDGLDWQVVRGFAGLDLDQGEVVRVVRWDDVWLAYAMRRPAGVMGGEMVLLVSEDGLHWSDVALPDNRPFAGTHPPVVGRDGFLLYVNPPEEAADEPTTVWTSTDGRSWTARPTNGTSISAEGHGLYVTTGTATDPPNPFRPRAGWSEDGLVWNDAPVDGFDPSLETSMNVVGVLDHGFLAVGDTGSEGSIAWTSLDGRSWQAADGWPGGEAGPRAVVGMDDAAIALGEPDALVNRAPAVWLGQAIPVSSR